MRAHPMYADDMVLWKDSRVVTSQDRLCAEQRIELPRGLIAWPHGVEARPNQHDDTAPAAGSRRLQGKEIQLVYKAST